jgi:hypothetical protein
LRRLRYALRAASTCVGLTMALWLVQVPALAQMSKEQCVDANTRGQHLRTDGKLSEAREQLRQCGDPSCPAIVRDDCARRLDDLDRVQPTIAFEVKDPSGADVSAVKVTMDGKLLTERLDGKPLPVDVGERFFTFEVDGQPPVTLTRTLVLTEGEKGRRERIVLGGGTASASAPVSPIALVASGRVGRLIVAADPGATVFIDDADHGKGNFDDQLRVGEHAVLVTEPGKMPYRTEVQVNDGETQTVRPVLQALPGGAQRGWGTTSAIVGGIGIGLSVAGGLLLKIVFNNTNVPAGCVNNVCTTDGINARNSIRVAGDVATGVFIGGAALFAGGIVLHLTAPSSKEPVRATVAAGPGGVALRGSW